MGTGNSNAAAVSISVDTDGGILIPGDIISGTVYVTMLKKTVGVHDLTVKIVGEEATLIDYSSKHCNQSNGTEIYEARSVIFVKSEEFTLTDADVEETYAFPFSFPLPYGLPPSRKFTSPHNKKDLCSINYRVEVKMTKHRKLFLLPAVVAKGSLPLFVPYQPVTAVSPLLSTYISEKDVYVGSSYMNLRLSVFFVCSHDDSISLFVSYTVGNYPIVKIQQIELTVAENVSWNADGHSTKFSKTLASRTISKHELCNCENSCGLSIKRGDHSPAYDGKLMRIHHEFIMKVTTSSFHTKNPIISTEISLPQIPDKMSFQADGYCSSSSPMAVLTTSLLSQSEASEEFPGYVG
jgi:hypothetical protein